jgi:hypothetical protein
VKNTPALGAASTTESLGNSDNANCAARQETTTSAIYSDGVRIFFFGIRERWVARFLSQSRTADGDCWQRWRFNKTS